MLISFWIKIGVAASALLGVLLGSVGSYLMTSAYHPFAQRELWKAFIRALGFFVTFRFKKALQLISDTVYFAEVNQENKRLSLLGIYILFLSFVVQTVSALLAVIDVAINETQPH